MSIQNFLRAEDKLSFCRAHGLTSNLTEIASEVIIFGRKYCQSQAETWESSTSRRVLHNIPWQEVEKGVTRFCAQDRLWFRLF